MSKIKYSDKRVKDTKYFYYLQYVFARILTAWESGIENIRLNNYKNQQTHSELINTFTV